MYLLLKIISHVMDVCAHKAVEVLLVCVVQVKVFGVVHLAGVLLQQNYKTKTAD
jgi:hypothetical protein